MAAIIGRPGSIGHLGEYIASLVFDIELEESANAKSIDGRFRSGFYAGKSVNVKWYAKRESLLDLCTVEPPDIYLVLCGPPSAAVKATGPRPWLITEVFLFPNVELQGRLGEVRRGIATSLKKQVWEDFRVHPEIGSRSRCLTDEQHALLSLFAGSRA